MMKRSLKNQNQLCNFYCFSIILFYFSGKFIGVDAIKLGSCHDAQIFRTSGLCTKLKRDHRELGNGCLAGRQWVSYMKNLLVISVSA